MNAIHQMVPGLRCGDAISNQALTIQRLLRDWGYTSEIYAARENTDTSMLSYCYPYQEYASHPGQKIIYHHCIGSVVAEFLRDLLPEVILYYHNITPAKFIELINPRLAKGLNWGREQLDYFTHCPHVLAASEYNRRELLSRGYQQVDVLPYFIRFASLDKEISSEEGQSILTRYGDDRINWLFVGRVVPNKCQDDLIRIFAYYQHHIDPDACLLLVGPFSDTPGYYEELKCLSSVLGLTNVEFCGLALGDVLNAYYRVATGYISMSEHEGFGIPLIEAMHFGLPVIAYAAAAVPDTMEQAGILIHHKRFEVIAELLHLIATDSNLRAQIIAHQHERLIELAPECVAQRLQTLAQKWHQGSS